MNRQKRAKEIAEAFEKGLHLGMYISSELAQGRSVLISKTQKVEMSQKLQQEINQICRDMNY